MSKNVAQLSGKMAEIASVDRPRQPAPLSIAAEPAAAAPAAQSPPPDAAAGAPALVEPTIRFAIELPKSVHRRLKAWAVAEDATNITVSRALVTLLVNDDDVARRVRELIHQGSQQ
jgi:hypothetical protein